MSALLVLPEERIAQEVRYWQDVAAEEARWYRGWRRRILWLVLQCFCIYSIGLITAWSSLALTGDWAGIALWGGLLLGNAGPMVLGYGFWMRENGSW